RVWIAPEIQFSVRDRNNFWATLKTSDQVDPGNYTLTAESENKYVLSQDMQLDAYNLASGRKGLHIMRTIEKAEDPLRSLDNYDELIDGITFAGFEQTILLKELKNDGIMAEA
ncbi:MAG TPA: hypothetical protein GXX14_14395, partial [Clostridiaceae bacterium]|nr:hypothetical protein [Clostridiaceae bacterium]